MPVDQRIAILSAKGGEGRTFVATSLFMYFAMQQRRVELVGFDVEKPDLLHLNPGIELLCEEVESLHPVLERDQCNFCGNCAAHCRHKALVFDRYVPSVKLDVSSCFVCADCVKACTRRGIRLETRKLGFIYSGREGAISILAGAMSRNSSLLYPMVKVLADRISRNCMVVCDFAPGLQQIYEEALLSMHFAVLVSDFHEIDLPGLEALANTLKDRNIRFGILFNKFFTHAKKQQELIQFCQENSFPLLGFWPVLQNNVNSLLSADNEPSEAEILMNDVLKIIEN